MDKLIGPNGKVPKKLARPPIPKTIKECIS